MKLYHHCRRSDLESIAETGLHPHVPKESVMSLGQEVVWLTEDPSTDVTEEDLDHWRRVGGFTEADLEEIRRHGWLLESGRTHCLTVRIRTGEKKLQHYATWMRLNGDIPIIDENGRAWASDDGEIYSARHVLERQCPRIVEKWWVYFGGVPRSAIEELPPKPKKKPKLAGGSRRRRPRGSAEQIHPIRYDAVGVMTSTNAIGGLWHPTSEPDDEDAAANRSMNWAGLIEQVMSGSSDDGDGAGFGFVCAAVEHFSELVMREDPNGPWAKYAALFLSDEEPLQ